MDGTYYAIRDIMGGETTMFLFLRHFGCVICKLRIYNLMQKAESFVQLGINIIFGMSQITSPFHLTCLVLLNGLDF